MTKYRRIRNPSGSDQQHRQIGYEFEGSYSNHYDMIVEKNSYRWHEPANVEEIKDETTLG